MTLSNWVFAMILPATTHTRVSWPQTEASMPPVSMISSMPKEQMPRVALPFMTSMMLPNVRKVGLKIVAISMTAISMMNTDASLFQGRA